MKPLQINGLLKQNPKRVRVASCKRQLEDRGVRSKRELLERYLAARKAPRLVGRKQDERLVVVVQKRVVDRTQTRPVLVQLRLVNRAPALLHVLRYIGEVILNRSLKPRERAYLLAHFHILEWL